MDNTIVDDQFKMVSLLQIDDQDLRERAMIAMDSGDDFKVFSQKGIIWIHDKTLIDYLAPINDSFAPILYVLRIIRDNSQSEENYFKIANLDKAYEYGHRIKEIDDEAIVHILQLNSEYDSNKNTWCFTSFTIIRMMIL